MVILSVDPKNPAVLICACADHQTVLINQKNPTVTIQVAENMPGIIANNAIQHRAAMIGLLQNE